MVVQNSNRAWFLDFARRVGEAEDWVLSDFECVSVFCGRSGSVPSAAGFSLGGVDPAVWVLVLCGDLVAAHYLTVSDVAAAISHLGDDGFFWESSLMPRDFFGSVMP